MGFRWLSLPVCKGSLTKVHYPKLYNMAQLLAFNVLLLPKDLTIIFICIKRGQCNANIADSAVRRHSLAIWLSITQTRPCNIQKTFWL